MNNTELEREVTHEQTMRTLNALELWLRVGMLTVEIMRQHVTNATNEH